MHHSECGQLKISCWSPKSVQRSAAAATLVVLGHGTGNDRFYPLRALIEALMMAGYSVASADLPGHGHCQQDAFTVKNLQKWWPLLMESLMLRMAPARLVVVGHSLSAAMLLPVLHQPSRQEQEPSGKVAAAVLMAPPTRVAVAAKAVAYELLYSLDPALVPQLSRYGLWGILPAFRSFKRSEFPIRLPEGDGCHQQDYLTIVQRYLEESVLPLLKGSQEDDHPSGQPRVPSLVVTGAKDMIAPQAAAERYCSRLRGELQTIACANHFTLPFKSQTISAILNICHRMT